MFHVWGQDKLNDLCRSRPQLLHQVLDEVVVTSIFQKNNHLQDVRIICIGGLHWVALTSQFYYDHDQCYQVLDHSTCLTTLNQMNTYEVPADPRKTHNVKTKEEYHLAEVKITSRTTRTRLNSWIDKFATPKKDLVYPTNISDVGHGHLRAIFNVWGIDRLNALMKKNPTICEKYLDDKAVMPVFQESKQAEDGRIFFLDEVHWVAVTIFFILMIQKNTK